MKRIYINTLFACIIILIACKEDGGAVQPTPIIQEDEFKNPVLTSSPDPWVFQKGDWYYFTHTTGNSIRLYRSKKMSDLSSAEVKTIWSPPSEGMNSKNIWAPELHFVQGKWYFYYAADNGVNANHRMWVLENSSEDPFHGTWVDKGELELPDDKWAIDGTIVEHNDELFFLWSGWEGDTDIQQNIYIASMTDPLTVAEPRVCISKPEHSWEKNGNPPAVNEGPQFIRYGDKVFLTFSASGCWTDQYALGLLSADASANMLDPDVWTKTSQPVFETNSTAQAFSPGHNGFFKSPDGTEDWLIYHANNAAGLGCGSARSFRIQKFTWNENGFPVFGQPASLSTILKKPSGE